MPDICFGKRLLGLLDTTGGLLVMVRNPIVMISAEFIPFCDNGFLCLEDWIGRKGFLAFSVVVGERDFYMVNTHLHMRILGSRVHHRRVRVRQIKQMLSFVDSIQSVFPTVLLGDFNCESQDEEYQHILQAGFVDLTSNVESDLDQRGNRGDAQHCHSSLSGRPKVDYIFANNIGAMTWNSRKVCNNPFLSDHYGILTEIKC